MATIKDVAVEAGVSISTVSRVINNSLLVTEEKRNKVMQAIKKVGYEIPRRIAIRGIKNKIILVITTMFSRPLLDGFRLAANEMGYVVLFELLDDSPDTYDQCTDVLRLLEKDILCGVILVNVMSKSEKVAALFGSLPVVQVGEYYPFDPTYVVLTDDEKASYEMTSLLIEKGKRKIAYTALEDNFLFNLNRIEGYRNALQRYGLEQKPEYIYRADYSIEGGRDAARYFLSLSERPDAICCVVDTIAVGCVKELISQGIRIPDDIAVTGFDDSYMAETIIPEITTVAQSYHEISAEAIRCLDLIIQGKSNIGRKIIIPHTLIERETT